MSCYKIESSHDTRKTPDGPTRSATGVVPKKHGINRNNVSPANIRGPSKSSVALNKVCREHRTLPVRAVSSISVRCRTQSVNRNLSGPSRSKENERTLSQTSFKTKDPDKSVSRMPRSKESDRNLTWQLSKSRESDRNLSRVPSKSRESDRNLSRVPSKSRESDRNLSRVPSKSRESDRNLTRVPSKSRESDRNRLQSKTKESDRNLSRLPPKGRESDRNLFQRQPKGKESDRNLSRLPTKGRESDRNLARLPSKNRESDRNLARAPRIKESDYSVARSTSKVRKSDRNLPRLPFKSRNSDRNVSRSATKVKISDRNIARPTQSKENSRPASRGDKQEPSQFAPKSKSSERLISPRAPASSASVSGIARGQSTTRIAGRAKQKSGILPKSGGIPPLSSHKIFSQLSLKKLSSFAFKKKVPPKKTPSVQNDSTVKLKRKGRPQSANSAHSSTRLDEATQSSGQWTGPAGTSAKPSRESIAKQKSLSRQQSQKDQRTPSRPTGSPDRRRETPSPKGPKERPASQDVLCVSKSSVGRRLGPAYQQEDIFSVESFVDSPEKSAPVHGYECHCLPENSAAKASRPKEESVSSGESLTKPKEDSVCSPEISVGEPIKPEEGNICFPRDSEDMSTDPPARDSVCLPEVSTDNASMAQQKQAEVPPLRSSVGESSRSPLQVDSFCAEVPTQATYPKGQDSIIGHDCNPKDEFRQTIASHRDVNSRQISTDRLSKADETVLKRSKSQLDVIFPPAVSSERPSKYPPKREMSNLKRTISECICVPTISSDHRQTTKEDPCLQTQQSPTDLTALPKTVSRTVDIDTKAQKSEQDIGTRDAAERVTGKPSRGDDSHPYKPASEPAVKPASEPSIKPRLEKDDSRPKVIQSMPDLEAVRDALGKKAKEVNVCVPKTEPKPSADQGPVVKTRARVQAVASEERRRGEQVISPESFARSRQVGSEQDTPGTPESSTGVAQYQLYAVREGTEPQSDETEAPSDALCSYEMSRESLPVSDGHDRGVSRPPPAVLTRYAEESSHSAEESAQSHTESIRDSGGSSISKNEAPVVNTDESLTAGEKEVLLEEEGYGRSKDGAWTMPAMVPLAESKRGNDVKRSSDSTEPPPDESNLSSDGSREKERSLDSEYLLQPEPTPAKSKSPMSPSEKENGRSKAFGESGSKPAFSKTKLSDHDVATNPRRPKPSQGTEHSEQRLAKTVEGKPLSSQERNVSSEKPPKKPAVLSPPKKSSSDARSKDMSNSNGSSGKSPSCDKQSDNDTVDRPICLPHIRRSTAESNDSIIQRMAEQAEAFPAEEGTAARCEPITKLKLKKQHKEPTQSDLRDIQEDIRIWKDLYAGCLERLRSLQQMNQAPIRTNKKPDKAQDHGSPDKLLRRASNNGQCNLNEAEGGINEAVRVLESEYGQVESALRKHSAVLAELVSVLQNRMTAQPEAPSAGETDQDGVKDVKDSIHYLKALITENETLTMQLAAERAKQQVLRQVQVTNDVVDESISATEDKLHRTNSLLKMQMKRLQYEISRLTEAQNIETRATTILVDQAEADIINDLGVLNNLQESNERLHELLSSKRFVSGQRVFKRASRGSFLSEEAISSNYCSIRRDQLEFRLVISDRVQRNVEISNDEITCLHTLGRRMCNQIYETTEEIRKNEFAWLQLRKERDELTKDLYPDLERLHKMQDVAKEKLDLESKLRKENVLFRHQLEEFQKDLLEVETELMSGAITRRTEATKNKVVELETLYENAKLHNAKLREECDSKNLTISRYDSLASLSIDEEEFQRQISEKIKRMELRIQADMDRRLLRPKRYVFEAPGKAKISFRGQRNVIRAPKNVAEWRRKREAPPGVSEPPKPQQPKDAPELRREILAKLAEEKEKAKEQLLRYEAHQVRHAADSRAEPNAQELNELLGRLGRFLNQTRAKEPSPARPAAPAAATSLHGGEFGETLMHLIVQLDQLQSALTGEDSRRRTVRPPTLASERHRELLETLPNASKRGSRGSNPTRPSNGNNGNNNNSNNNNNNNS